MKFQLNLPYLGYNTVLGTLEIRHYGPVCDVSETGLYIKLSPVALSAPSARSHIESDMLNILSAAFSLFIQLGKATITQCDLSLRFVCIDATLLCEFESDKI